MTDRLHRLAHLARRRRVERVLLALHRATHPLVGPGGVALRDEPLDPDRLSGREQMIRALGPQAVGQREVAIEMAHVERVRDRRQLMDDHVGLRGPDRFRDLVGIERVRHHGRCALLEEHRLLGFAARHSGDLVARGH
jgi:hypothetical protein